MIKGQINKKIQDVFREIGSFPDQVQISLKKGSMLIASIPRKVPIKLR